MVAATIAVGVALAIFALKVGIGYFLAATPTEIGELEWIDALLRMILQRRAALIFRLQQRSEAQ